MKPLLTGDPRVPEVEERPRLESADLLARHVETEVVPELDAPHVVVEDRLHLVDEGLALLGVGLPDHLREELVLLLVAPPAGPVALDARGDGGIGPQAEARGEDVEQLGLVAALDEGSP